MAVTRRLVRGLSPRAVFDVLRDGLGYGDWVVGTRTIRAADPGWPEVGSQLHYRTGRWPLRKDGHTTARGYRPDAWLELEAHAWPLGTARIVLTAEERDDGVQVSIEEHPQRGVAARLHNPALDLLVKLRNVETLRRLEAKARDHRAR
jgi:hypothetical protein